MTRFADRPFDDTDEFIPGKYAEDVKVALLFLSGALFMAGLVASLLDGWESSVFLVLQSIWLCLMYIALERR